MFEWEHHGEAERWLPVVGYEAFYQVSDRGNVKGIRRKGSKGGLLRPGVSAGHLTVCLYRGKEGVSRLVHHLVLEAFVSARPDGMHALHGPGGPLDNRLANLSWGTPSKNMGEDKIRDGTIPWGENCGAAKLTAAIVAECKRRYGAGETQTALAAEFGVSTSVMSEAVNGKSWAHLADPADVVRPRTWLTGEKHSQAKLTWGSVAEIRRRYAAGEMQRPLGAEFGVSQAVVSSIVRGKTWKLPA